MKFAKIRVIFVFVFVFLAFLAFFCSDRRAEEMAIPNMMTIVYIYLGGYVDVPFVGLSS